MIGSIITVGGVTQQNRTKLNLGKFWEWFNLPAGQVGCGMVRIRATPSTSSSAM